MTTHGEAARARLRAALDEMASSLPTRAVDVSHKPKIDQYEFLPGPPAADIEVAFGDGWCELNVLTSEFQLDLTKAVDNVDWLLAICDAVRDGRVWDLRSRRTCRTVYLLRSRGFRQVLRDTNAFTCFSAKRPRCQRIAPWPREFAAT